MPGAPPTALLPRHSALAAIPPPTAREGLSTTLAARPAPPVARRTYQLPEPIMQTFKGGMVVLRLRRRDAPRKSGSLPQQRRPPQVLRRGSALRGWGRARHTPTCQQRPPPAIPSGGGSLSVPVEPGERGERVTLWPSGGGDAGVRGETADTPGSLIVPRLKTEPSAREASRVASLAPRRDGQHGGVRFAHTQQDVQVSWKCGHTACPKKRTENLA